MTLGMDLSRSFRFLGSIQKSGARDGTQEGTDLASFAPESIVFKFYVLMRKKLEKLAGCVTKNGHAYLFGHTLTLNSLNPN